MKKLLVILAGMSLLAYLGCEKKTETTEPETTATPTAATGEGTEPATGEAKEGEAKPGEPTGDTATADEAKPEEPELGLSESKEMLGLALKPLGKWKPVWDADAKAAKWENPALGKAITIYLVADKLDNAEDLKAAAPNMTQLGSAIKKIVKQKKTKKGWWATVKRDKDLNFVYVQKIGEKQLVCSASLTKGKKGAIPQPMALKLCESIKMKPEEVKKEEPKEEAPADAQEKAAK